MNNRYAFVLTIAGAGMFLSTLDSGVINVALPFLQQEFHTTVNTISWTISGYFLVLSATVVLCGKLGDRFGRVNMFSAGLLLFALGSLLCGLAFSANQLIAWRALQALGAAAMQGTAAGIITTLIHPQYKNRALGMLGLIIGIGPVIGPTFAGTVIAFASWRWIFFVNIPICLLALLGARHLPDTGEYEQAPLDGFGMVLFALTIFSLVLALTVGGRPHGDGLLISGLALLALLSLLFFLYQERRTSSPMLDLRLFTIVSFSVSLMGTLTFGFVTAVIFMLPPLELHHSAHLSAWHIGLISLSAPLGVVILSRFSGMAIDRWGEQRLVLTGLLVMLVALLLLALRQPSWGVVSFPPLLFLYGVGGGIFIPPNMSHIMKSAGAPHQGTMGAITRMLVNLGNAIGVAAAALVIGIHASQAQTQLMVGLRQTWLLAVGMLTIAVVAAIVDLRRERATYNGFRDKKIAMLHVHEGIKKGIMTNALPASYSPDVPPAHHLLAMMFGTVQTHLIRVAAQLRLADLLKDGHKSIAELAEATGTDASALTRVMRALTDLGLVVETATRQFTCTSLGDLLRSDTPDSLRSYALLVGSEWLTRPWPNLLQSVQTGTSVFEQVFGTPLYEYMQYHPDAAAVFNDALTAISKQEAIALREAYDFSEVRTLVDVGGGRGLLLATLFQAYPLLRGVLFDLPLVVAGAQALLQPAVASGRCHISSGDFFLAVPPGGEVYLLKRILPAFTDTQARTILRTCRDAMAPEGRVLVADPDTSSLYGSLFDIAMLVIFGGRLRTDAELQELFAGAGLTLTRTMGTRSTLRLVEGIPM